MDKETQEFINQHLQNQTCSLCLNVGCGNRIMEGYINIDLHNPKADVKWDLREPLPYKDNSIDVIYAQHIIEHFTRLEWRKIKTDWYRVLRPEGILIIECPDILRWMKRFIEDENNRWSYWILGIYGGQEEHGEGQLHKNGFSIGNLSVDLEEEGFDILEYSYLQDVTPNPNGNNLQVRAIK